MLQFIIRNSLVAIQLPLTREARILCGARDYCSFAMVVRVTAFGATGGASPSPTKSERDSAENLIDGADGKQSPPSRLGIVSEL